LNSLRMPLRFEKGVGDYRYPDFTVKNLLFGQYLRKRGLVTTEDIINARLLQMRNNRKLGEIAKARGWMTQDEIDRVLIIQEETLERFGEIAIREGFLSQAQVDVLLKEQKDNYLFFGEALVRLGVISHDVLIDELKRFNQSRLREENGI